MGVYIHKCMCVCAYLYRKIMDHMHAITSAMAISEVQDYVFYSICSLLFFFFFFDSGINPFEKELET